MQGAPAAFGGCDAEAQLFQRRLGFDDDGVGAGVDEGGGLFFKGSADLGFGEIAEGFEQPAERADVADDVTVTVAEGLARDAHGGLIDATPSSAWPWRVSMMREPPKVLVRRQSEPAST